ncbi:MAG: hypothetical protein ACK5JM_00035 [Rhodoblastus sp.]
MMRAKTMMRVRTNTFAILAAFGLVVGASAAQAADYPGQNQRYGYAPAVWQGHFTGGRNLAPGRQPTALDWVDTTRRFATLRECAGWMRAMSREYSTYEGWKGCLRIR